MAESYEVAGLFPFVLCEIANTRRKFGEQSLNLLDWSCILGEEYGEVCRSVADTELHGEEDYDHIMAELIQVAAVALHMAAVVHGDCAP